MSVLTFDAVGYRYPGADEPALRDVSLAVEPGEFVVLAGATGSGKSTLLRAAAGLVPHFHGGTFAGRVTVGGLDTRESGPAQISVVAGTLGQDPETQVVMSRVRAEIALPLEQRGGSGASVARGVEEAALALGIGGLLDRPTHELSGGELQRVALAAAIAGRPAVLLLDEPTSQLDPVAGDELLTTLRRLNEEHGTAVVLSEHRLERCLTSADRVVALRGGAVACDADPRTFLEWAGAEAPELQTPAARLFSLAGLAPLPVGVKEARRALARVRGLGDGTVAEEPRPVPGDGVVTEAPRPLLGDSAVLGAPPPAPRRGGAALEVGRVWYELPRGPAILRGVDLRVHAGEAVALMGRNGAGKSTLLRCAAGLVRPTRGRVRTAGRVVLLLQHPGDYFVHDRVGAEVSVAALADAGLSSLAARHPRDLSGGERQRLALAVVLDGDRPPAVLCLDEPTRGMDRARKEALAAELEALRAAGTAVVVATHDAEFAAEVAERTVLLGPGEVLADAPTAEVLGGGWYFATQVARVLDGAALRPEQGAALLARGAPAAQEARA